MLFLANFLGLDGRLDFRVELGDGHGFREHGLPVSMQRDGLGRVFYPKASVLAHEGLSFLHDRPSLFRPVHHSTVETCITFIANSGAACLH
jgi:hypothetical protein